MKLQYLANRFVCKYSYSNYLETNMFPKTKIPVTPAYNQYLYGLQIASRTIFRIKKIVFVLVGALKQ